MGYEIKADGNEVDDIDIDLVIVDGASDYAGFDPDDEVTDDEDVFDTDRGGLLHWPTMFDGLSDSHRDDLLMVLAEAWAGNLDRPESADDVLIDDVLEEVGQDGFANILVTAEGFPRTVGGLLLSAIFLDSYAERITKVTRYKKREVETTASSIHDQVLHGDVDDARTATVDALTNLHKSLAITMEKNRRSGRLRIQAESLRVETATLLNFLDAPIPTDEGKRKKG